MTWMPPWKPGQPLENCADCRDRVVASTLVVGLCANCITPEARRRPEQLPLEAVSS